MSTPVTRRAVTSGIAWSVPAVAATAAAPAFATSKVNCAGNIPAGVAPFWPSNGAHTLSTTGGGLETDMTTAYNYGINDKSNKGSVTLKFNDGASQTYVAKPYVTLTNGQTLYGTATLGGTGTFVAPTGVSASVSVLWYGSNGLTNDTLWNGVTAHIPFIYYWTDPSDKRVYSAQYEMLVTYPASGSISAGVQPTTVKYAAAGYGCAANNAKAPTLTSVTPNYPKAGSTVTLTGKGFTGATQVRYYSANLQYTVVNDTTITATMPTTWPAGMLAGLWYNFVVCNNIAGCSNGVGIARG